MASYCLACTPDGIIWHSFYDYIRLLRNEGATMKSLGSAKLVPGKSSYDSIAFDMQRGEVFVGASNGFFSDQGGVHVLGLDGSYLRRFPGSFATRFDSAPSLAWDSKQERLNVFTVSHVQTFDRNGKFLSQWAAPAHSSRMAQNTKGEFIFTSSMLSLLRVRACRSCCVNTRVLSCSNRNAIRAEFFCLMSYRVQTK